MSPKFLLGFLLFFLCIDCSFAGDPNGLCTGFNKINLSGKCDSAVKEISFDGLKDNNYQGPGYNKGACKNAYIGMGKFHSEYKARIADYCNNPNTITSESINSCKQADCLNSYVEMLDPLISSLKGAKEVMNNYKTRIEKELLERNIKASLGMYNNAESIRKIKFSVKQKEWIESALKSVGPSSTIDFPNPSNETRIDSKDPALNQEILAAKELKNVLSGISEASQTADNLLKTFSDSRGIVQARIDSLNGPPDKSGDPPPVDTSSGFFSGMGPGQIMQMAATGLGIYQALKPPPESGITEQAAPVPGAPEKVALSNKGSADNKTAPVGAESNTPTPGSDNSGFSAGSGYVPVSDISKDGESGSGEHGSGSPVSASSGGGSPMGGGSDGAPPADDKKDIAANPMKPGEEDVLVGFGGGGLKYQGTSGSSTPEPSPFDESVKSILSDAQSAGEDGGLFDGAYSGENAERNPGSESGYSEDGIEGADGPSLFARMRSFHDRCLKKGCVINGIGEKI